MRTRFEVSERVIFVSDVHLRFGDADYLGGFLRFLEGPCAGVSALFVHGDLFDFYIGPRQGRAPFYRPLLEGFRRLTGAGTPVAILHGNRDYLIGPCFASAGVHLLPPEIGIELGSLRAHLSHGDQFCIHDRSYQFWARGVLRAAPLRWFVRNLPVPVAVWLARRYRGVSRRKARRSGPGTGQGRLPTVFDGVLGLISRERWDAVICGHIHELARTDLGPEGGPRTVLYTTGAWEEGPNWIEFRDGGLRTVRAARG